MEVRPQGLVPAIGKIESLITWTQGNLPGGVPSIVSQAAYVVAIQTNHRLPIERKAEA